LQGKGRIGKRLLLHWHPARASNFLKGCRTARKLNGQQR
jgi:hypothetical protein